MKQSLHLILYIGAVLLALTSCKPHMDILGTTTIPELEDRMLYLRIYKDGIYKRRQPHKRSCFSPPYSPRS